LKRLSLQDHQTGPRKEVGPDKNNQKGFKSTGTSELKRDSGAALGIREEDNIRSHVGGGGGVDLGKKKQHVNPEEPRVKKKDFKGIRASKNHTHSRRNKEKLQILGR